MRGFWRSFPKSDMAFPLASMAAALAYLFLATKVPASLSSALRSTRVLGGWEEIRLKIPLSGQIKKWPFIAAATWA